MGHVATEGDMQTKGRRSMGNSSGGELGGEPGSGMIIGNREARRRAVKRETRKFFRRAENRSAGTEVIGGVRVRQGIRGRVIEEIVRSRTLQDHQGGDRSEVMSRVGQLEAESEAMAERLDGVGEDSRVARNRTLTFFFELQKVKAQLECTQEALQEVTEKARRQEVELARVVQERARDGKGAQFARDAVESELVAFRAKAETAFVEAGREMRRELAGLVVHAQQQTKERGRRIDALEKRMTERVGAAEQVASKLAWWAEQQERAVMHRPDPPDSYFGQARYIGTRDLEVPSGVADGRGRRVRPEDERGMDSMARDGVGGAQTGTDTGEQGARHFDAGDLVVIHGLRAEPTLNGQSGRVLGHDANGDRYRVELEDGRGFKVRPANLARNCEL